MPTTPKATLHTLIVDADINSLRHLHKLVLNSDRLTLAQKCKTGRAALRLLREEQADLIIMNPALPDVNGFELLSAMEDKPPVIIVSNREDYAYFAFRVEATDYLLKPLTAAKLDQSIDRVMKLLAEKQELADLRARYAAEKEE